MITITNRKTNATESGIYVGRPSPLGNPYPVLEHTRDRALEMYRKWLRLTIAEKDDLDDRTARASNFFWNLVEKVKKGESIELVCWCKPLHCHGDIIKEEIERQIRIETSYNNYLSHSWQSSISDFETGEKTRECENCGCEDKGDPREFDWLEYPHCERTDP